MKEVVSAFWDGMLGSFLLAWAIILMVILGNGRHLFRLADQFVRSEPLEVAPGRVIRIPNANAR